MAESLPQARTGVIQHPSAPAEKGGVPESEPVFEDVEARAAEELAFETRKLIRMLKEEIGLRWCSLELRLQVEECEIILGDR
jgi:hypothetical protein